MSATSLGPAGVSAFEARGINPEIAARFGIYTASRSASDGVVPDHRGNIIVFPYTERGAVVAEKYRQLPWSTRRFWQRDSGRKTFWNADVIDDPALAAGTAALVITEGEPDAITAVDCGFPFAVSVPDGAPPVPKGKEPDELDALDPTSEATGKFEFIWNNRDRLKAVKRFILAVDNDAPGQRLAAELVRRLSASRCLFVTYPEGCKDLNEVRVMHGPEVVARVLNEAQPYPVHGLYRLAEFPELPPIPTFATGWETLDSHLKIFPGELMFVLGMPGAGKSVWLANLLANLTNAYGWRAAIFSPEEPTVPHLRDKFRRISGGMTTAHADAWINDRFVFICADPTGRMEQEMYLDWIIDRATDAVLRDGIKVLVIDPWNEIEHARLKNESQTEYIGRAIRMLNRFRRQYDVAVFVAIHPTKEVGRDGKARPPTPYDADGSAHFFNKADHFLILHRPDDFQNRTAVRVSKVKFEGTGERGLVYFAFDRNRSRFELLDAGDKDEQRLEL
jgi:twinkle protein